VEKQVSSDKVSHSNVNALFHDVEKVSSSEHDINSDNTNNIVCMYKLFFINNITHAKYLYCLLCVCNRL